VDLPAGKPAELTLLSTERRIVRPIQRRRNWESREGCRRRARGGGSTTALGRQRTTDLDALSSDRGDNDYPIHTNPRYLAACGIESDPRTVSGTSSS